MGDDETIEVLWRVKDEIAREHGHQIQRTVVSHQAEWPRR